MQDVEKTDICYLRAYVALMNLLIWEGKKQLRVI